MSLSCPVSARFPRPARLPSPGRSATRISVRRDYEWLWFETSDLMTFTYSCAKVAQKLSTGGYSATPYILGICINVFKAEEATSTNAKGNYNVVYQFNIDAGNVGLQFKRKVEN